MTFTHTFCQMSIENLLKGPAHPFKWAIADVLSGKKQSLVQWTLVITNSEEGTTEFCLIYYGFKSGSKNEEVKVFSILHISPIPCMLCTQSCVSYHFKFLFKVSFL